MKLCNGNLTIKCFSSYSLAILATNFFKTSAKKKKNCSAFDPKIVQKKRLAENNCGNEKKLQTKRLGKKKRKKY